MDLRAGVDVAQLPPVVLVGVLLAAPGLAWRAQQERLVALLACVVFPIVYVVGTGATLYDAMRHLLFVIPPLAVLASAGWVRALEATSGGARLLVAAALVAGLVEPLGFQWRNHPNQVAYVQPLAGGPAAAFGRYDLDYWGNCMLAVDGAVGANSIRGSRCGSQGGRWWCCR